MSKSKLYWILQLGGWAFFITLQIVFYGLSNAGNFNALALINFFFWYVFAVLLTHGFRFVILKTNLIHFGLVQQIITVIVSSIILAILYHLLQYLIASVTIGHFAEFRLTDSVKNVIDATYIFFFWSLIYFSYHYIQNYKKAEITNLKYKVAMNEIELNKLKSQLNPHFMFNAMNSIRALIGENPSRAKEAVTMLSNILRNTLLMEKNKLIGFDDELRVVKDYLSLEHIRFEERLQYEFDIDAGASRFKVPTLMIQTLVENGIKHGISHLPHGGKIFIKAVDEGERVFIQIKNSGALDEKKVPDTGFGIKSTRQRLELLFGEKGSFRIYGEPGFVVSELRIPQETS